MALFQLIETVTSTLAYNFRKTAATDIKYVLVESFESAECFLESIKFYAYRRTLKI